MPKLSVRAQVYFGPPPAGATAAALHGGPDDIGQVVDQWIDLGLDELLLDIDETDPGRAVAKMERVHAEVLAPRAPRVTLLAG